MEVTQSRTEGLKREFEVVLAAADLAARVEGQLAEIKAKARIPGFRPGKVPVSHLKRLYGRSIMAEALEESINEASRKIIDEHGLRLATRPEIVLPDTGKDIEKLFETQSDLPFTVKIEVLPKVELHDLGHIEIERPVAEVSESDIEQVLTKLAESNRKFEAKGADAVAESGDKATVNFTGTIGGEAFEGGSGKDVDVTLGSGSFLPGFEAQILGMKEGEQRTVNVAFPENYGVAKLAGKEAAFDVTLVSLAAPAAAEIGDELAKGLGFEDLAKLRDGIRASIERDYSAASRAKWKRNLLDALDKEFPFEVPESMVAQEFDAIWRKAEAERRHSGRSFEDDKTTEEAERADYRKIAERRVRLGLLLAEIGQQAEITVTDDEVARAISQRARAFPGEDKAVWDFYRKNPQALAEVRAPMFEEKVVDHIISKVKATDKTVSKDELLKPGDDEDGGPGPSGNPG
ncbi:MAG: trigger factor [Methylocapsa sp.]|nr:trigger factor [Methylocapsa sp.]